MQNKKKLYESWPDSLVAELNKTIHILIQQEHILWICIKWSWAVLLFSCVVLVWLWTYHSSNPRKRIEDWRSKSLLWYTAMFFQRFSQTLTYLNFHLWSIWAFFFACCWCQRDFHLSADHSCLLCLPELTLPHHTEVKKQGKGMEQVLLLCIKCLSLAALWIKELILKLVTVAREKRHLKALKVSKEMSRAGPSWRSEHQAFSRRMTALTWTNSACRLGTHTSVKVLWHFHFKHKP